MSADRPDAASGDDSPIERYLDELTRQLRDAPPRQLRHLLAETEAHLRDDADVAVAAGTDHLEAERQAVHRIGPVGEIVRAERGWQRLSLRALVEQVLVSAGLLGGLGAVAVGLSGVLAALIRAIGGARAVSGGGLYAFSPANCARWLAGQPAGTSCHDAAVSDWAAETVYYRIAFGLLGLFVIAAVLSFRRRWHTSGLPPVVTNTIATAAFAAAAVWTLGLGLDALVVSSGHGWGQWLSATPVAAAAATIFGTRLVHDLRDGPSALRVPG